MARGKEALRDRSYAIFGNRYVAEVVTAIAEETAGAGSRVTVRMIASRARLNDSLVQLVTKRLVNAELLQRLPQDRPRAAAYHEVQRSGGRWQALVDLCRRLADDSDGEM
ncbi:hypothetical protein [Saccharothrix deserti]|uniref:hypothetical protein n=1 Tax=Saccharothrix deserti TaxID=2593674 RepID=UPI00131DBF79|nr:hypothetical protein [Saccharothrix deserti]